MRKSRGISFLMGGLLLFAGSSALAHTESETNALIRSMLEIALIRPNFDVQTQSFKTLPRVKVSQQDFFAQEGVWTATEKREVFNWYLRNLSTTAIDRGMIAGRRWFENPMATAAISQCEVMSYTNALPIFIENINKVSDQSRPLIIRIVIAWSPMDESLVGLVKNIVTNDVVFNVAERNVAYRHYCSKLKEVGGESEDVEQGVDAMYDRREDPVGAVAIDQMLVHLLPGYSNSLGRIECARSILANEQSTNASKHYFSNVTNTLDGLLK